MTAYPGAPTCTLRATPWANRSTEGSRTRYVTLGRAASGTLKARHGTCQEIGIANRQATSGRAAQRRLLASFQRAERMLGRHYARPMGVDRRRECPRTRGLSPAHCSSSQRWAVVWGSSSGNNGFAVAHGTGAGGLSKSNRYAVTVTNPPANINARLPKTTPTS